MTIMSCLCPFSSCIKGNDFEDDDSAFIDRYQGEKNCIGQKHGYGSYLFTNGDRYEGCWKCNTMHGYGTYTFNSGKK